MNAIVINGESKVGATSVMGDMADHLEPFMDVQTGDAGRFFRTLDHDVQQYMGVDGDIGEPPYTELDAAIGVVLEAKTPFDNSIDRGDLERPAIGDTVSIVAKRPGVQAAGLRWYKNAFTQAHASGADVWVVNGRNPAERLEPVLATYGASIALSLLVYCEPHEAARRILAHKEGITNPTEAELRLHTAKVTARRDADRDRKPEDFPFEDPKRVVVFDPDACPYQSVELSRVDRPDRPLPVYFDNTDMNREEMRGYVQSLASAALSLTVST